MALLAGGDPEAVERRVCPPRLMAFISLVPPFMLTSVPYHNPDYCQALLLLTNGFIHRHLGGGGQRRAGSLWGFQGCGSILLCLEVLSSSFQLVLVSSRDGVSVYVFIFYF